MPDKVIGMSYPNWTINDEKYNCGPDEKIIIQEQHSQRSEIYLPNCISLLLYQFAFFYLILLLFNILSIQGDPSLECQGDVCWYDSIRVVQSAAHTPHRFPEEPQTGVRVSCGEVNFILNGVSILFCCATETVILSSQLCMIATLKSFRRMHSKISLSGKVKMLLFHWEISTLLYFIAILFMLLRCFTFVLMTSFYFYFVCP